MMRKMPVLLLFLCMLSGFAPVIAQNNVPSGKVPKVSVYYFHPGDRCPIDQAIEENTKSLLQSAFSKEIREGKLLFSVINTDDKANAQITGRFDINAQALYVVRLEGGKESRKDLTGFAFDYGQSNPGKFKAGLKEEVEKALK